MDRAPVRCGWFMPRREGLLASLKALNLPHEETLGAMRLPSIGADAGLEHLEALLNLKQPGGEQHLHSDRPEQVYFILEGKGLMTVGSETKQVGQGIVSSSLPICLTACETKVIRSCGISVLPPLRLMQRTWKRGGPSRAKSKPIQRV